MKKYNSLDACKLVMAIFVVAIHTHPFENCPYELVFSIYNSFASLAVPFFFLTSGFFLASKFESPLFHKSNLKTIRSYLYKIIKLYLIWTLIYLPMTIYNFIDTGFSFTKSLAIFLRNFFLIGQQYNSWPLWYLLSTIYALFGILTLLKTFKFSKNQILLIAIIVYVISIGVSNLAEYSNELPHLVQFLKKTIKSTIYTGRIFTGFFYISIGFVISKINGASHKFFFMFLILLLFNSLIDNSYINPFVRPLCAISLFKSIQSLSLRDSILFEFSRKTSMVVYFVHMYAWTAYYSIVYGEKSYGLDSFIATTLLSLFISLLYIVYYKLKYLKLK